MSERDVLKGVSVRLNCTACGGGRTVSYDDARRAVATARAEAFEAVARHLGIEAEGCLNAHESHDKGPPEPEVGRRIVRWLCVSKAWCLKRAREVRAKGGR